MTDGGQREVQPKARIDRIKPPNQSANVGFHKGRPHAGEAEDRATVIQGIRWELQIPRTRGPPFLV